MKQNSQDSLNKAEAKLEVIQLKVTQANQHLTHLENEVQAAGKLRQQLREDIEAETETLLAGRKDRLATVEAELDQRLSDIEAEIVTAKAELNELERLNLAKERELKGLDASLAGVQEQLQSANEALKAAMMAVEPYQRNKAALEAQILFLKEGVRPLEDQLIQLKEQVVELEAARSSALTSISELEATYSSRKTEAEADISKLLLKHQELEVAHAGMYQQYEQMSEDIAVRTKALDEREEVLKRREYKVAQDERMVARNAGLLSL